MMWEYVKKEICFLIKNPITYVGIFLLCLMIAITVQPYLNVYNNLRDTNAAVEYASDGDIDSGYIPTPQDELYVAALEDIRQGLINDFALTENEANDEIKKIKNWTIKEIADYLKEKYGVLGARDSFNVKKYKHVDYNEMQQYLENAFRERTYTSSFAYKYSDFLSIGSILFTAIIFLLLLARDMKKDIYSLIHTKAITGVKNIFNKFFAGIIYVYFIVMVLTMILNFIVLKRGMDLGFAVNFWDIWKSVLIFNCPNIMLAACIVIFVTLLFRNVLPTIPVLLLYFIYSNMGLQNMGNYVYQLKPFVLLIRFPEVFATVTMPAGTLFNQIYVILLTAILLVLSIKVWGRRYT